jgi:hypothetical protein
MTASDSIGAPTSLPRTARGDDRWRDCPRPQSRQDPRRNGLLPLHAGARAGHSDLAAGPGALSSGDRRPEAPVGGGRVGGTVRSRLRCAICSNRPLHRRDGPGRRRGLPLRQRGPQARDGEAPWSRLRRANRAARVIGHKPPAEPQAQGHMYSDGPRLRRRADWHAGS